MKFKSGHRRKFRISSAIYHISDPRSSKNRKTSAKGERFIWDTNETKHISHAEETRRENALHPPRSPRLIFTKNSRELSKFEVSRSSAELVPSLFHRWRGINCFRKSPSDWFFAAPLMKGNRRCGMEPGVALSHPDPDLRRIPPVNNVW